MKVCAKDEAAELFEAVEVIMKELLFEMRLAELLSPQKCQPAEET